MENIIDLFIRGIAVLEFAENGDIAARTKQRDEKLVEVGPVILAVSFRSAKA